jgi:hypothetical protein
MKKIILFSLFFMILNVCAAENEKRVTHIKEEFDKVKIQAAQAYIKREKSKESLLKTDLGRPYVEARLDCVKCRWMSNWESSPCHQYDKVAERILMSLSTTDMYTKEYLPALEEQYINTKKFEMLPLLIDLAGRVDPSHSSKEALLSTVDNMKISSTASSTMWLELVHDKTALDKRAQQELRDFVEEVFKN